jgi:hypothetical protein
MRLFCRLIVMLAALAASPVFAQSLLQGGPTTQNHIPQYSSSGNMQPSVVDGGGSGGGALGYNPSEIGITAISPTGVYPVANGGNGPNHEHGCFYDAPITNSGGYHYLCLDPNALGGGLLSYGAVGGAAVLPFNQIINGVSYTFAGVPTSLPNLTYLSIVLGTLQHQFDTSPPLAGYIAVGSSASPQTTPGSDFSITRYENYTQACDGNAQDTECNAALNVLSYGGATSVQTVSGVNIYVSGSSTVSQANVQGLNSHAWVTGSSINTAEGAYLEGDRGTSTGRGIGAEISGWNRVAVACAVRYGAAGLAGGTGDCDGILVAARETTTGYPDSSGVHLNIGANNSQWQEGVTVNVGAVKNIAFNDQSSATYTLTNLNAALTGTGKLILGYPTRPTINGTTPNAQLLSVTTTDFAADLYMAQFTNDSNGPGFDCYKSRATTIGGIAAVQSGDVLCAIVILGDDGTNSKLAGEITATVGGTVSTGVVPGAMHFYTANASGTITQALLLDDAQSGYVGSSGTAKIFDASGDLYANKLYSGSSSAPTFNGSTQVYQIQSVSTNDYVAGGIIGEFTADANSSGLNFYKSRATTIGGIAAVQINDNIGTFGFIADDGTNSILAGKIIVNVGGTVSPGVVPGAMHFSTANASGTLVQAELIDDAQALWVGPALSPIKFVDASDNVYGVKFFAGGTGGVTCTGPLTVVSSITIKGGIITAAAGTGGTCS